MNDLIEKFALESGIALGNNINEGSRRDLLNKFAELVIKECAGLFPLTFTDEKYQRRIDKTIMKHFGIEDKE
jgi:hypothetical protein